MRESFEPIVVEQAFDASKAAVWKAISEREQMIQWFFDNIPEFQAEVGFETQFDVTLADGSSAISGKSPKRYLNRKSFTIGDTRICRVRAK